jgi:hypothetical protein
MRTRKILSGLLVCSIVLSALPASAEPAGAPPLPAAASTPAPSAFRASLDRAATSAALVEDIPTNTPYGPARKIKQSPQFAATTGAGGGQATSGGGGMGAMSMILTLVGTAAGIGATVYMLKQMKKVQQNIPNIPKQ